MMNMNMNVYHHTIHQYIHTMWGPLESQVGQFTPITLVDGTYNQFWDLVQTTSNVWGPHIVGKYRER